MRSVILLDVDGVIVEPRAYQGCIPQTVALWARSQGLSLRREDLPTLEDVHTFEASGVHDVWDITAICCALVFHQSRKTEALIPAAGSLVDYRKTAIMLAPAVARGAHPPLVVLDAYRTLVSEHAGDLQVLEELLSESRDVYRCKTTAWFQNLLLGSHLFETTYGIPAAFAADTPLLEREDEVLIRAEKVEALRSLAREGKASVGVYTARPSAAPLDENTLRAYSPEAEVAMRMAGMSDFPLVGMGMMEWLAERKTKHAAELTKPHFTHAIAALLRALYPQADLPALLEEAFEISWNLRPLEESRLAEALREGLRIYVCEDTLAGLQPFTRWIERFECSRLPAPQLHSLGVATSDDKRKALQTLTSEVHPDINSALESIFAHLGGDLVSPKA